MNELSLFTGAGGGLLASKLLGWKTVCAVECDRYCQDVLFRRQLDGVLDRFPIWCGDIRTFDGHPWRGIVDVVSGGFPCQPFSSASRGRRVAEDMWPEMLRVIGEVKPRCVFGENVAFKPIFKAATDLQAIGYSDVRIVQASAASMGAPHIRERYWLLANANCNRKLRFSFHAEVAGIRDLSRLAWSEDASGNMGMDDGLANRMDRLKAIGNGQVPAVAYAMGKILMSMGEEQ